MGQYRTLLRQWLATGLFFSRVSCQQWAVCPSTFYSRELLPWLVEVGFLCGPGWPGSPSASVSQAAEVTDLGHGVWEEETEAELE